jgi:DNA-binding NarL/FixJ family response regulator
MTQSPTTLAQLPPRLIEIAEVIGQEQTAKLAKALGGQKINFASAETVPASHVVLNVLSLSAAQALHELFRGERVLIPSGSAYYRQQEVLVALRSGLRPREIAEELKVTIRTIEHIRRLLIAANLAPFPEAQLRA